MYISTDREGNCLSYLWLMAPSSCEMNPKGFVFFYKSMNIEHRYKESAMAAVIE